MRLLDKFRAPLLLLALAAAAGSAAAAGAAATPKPASSGPAANVPTAPAAPAAADPVIDAAVLEVMRQYDIPGMAIAVTRNGQQRFFNYGDASVSYTHLTLPTKRIV